MLNTQANMTSYDDFYEALISAHQGMSTEESHAMNARLVLLLGNHVGDMNVLREALRIARAVDPSHTQGTEPERTAIMPVAPSHAAF